MAEPQLELKHPLRKVLIVKPSSLGDIIHSLPVLHALKNKYPEAEVHWVVARGFEDVLDEHPLIGKLWVINKDTWKRLSHMGETLSELAGLVKSLRAEKYDCIIDLQGLLRSGLITKAAGSRLRIGFREAREGSRAFYTHTVEGGREIHAVDRYLKLAAFLGCDTKDVQFPFPPLKHDLNDIIDIPDISPHGFAVMVPGARKPANRWPPERFGVVASLLPVRTLVLGSRGDRDIAGRVVAASEGRAISLAGKTDLPGLIAVIRSARLIVCNDTGPMHIAAALGIPVFAIFGPANPVRTGPYGIGHTVIKSDVPCAPCYKKNCSDPKCMLGISTDEVSRQVLAVFDRGPRKDRL